jgi:hypothetical protein
VQVLNFPEYEFHIQELEQKKVIFDPIRKKFIPLSPEEWVRQHCICHLVQRFNLPIGLIAVEREIQVHGLRKRFDIVGFASSGSPLILIECKATSVELTQETLIQVATYNNKLDSPWMWITNGIQHAWFERKNGKTQLVAAPEKLI